MLRAALVCLASALASGATDDPAVSKFSVRNLSGGFIGLWWIDHRGRQLVAQSAVAVRHTSSVEINSFRGHRFVIRRLRRKARLADVPYEPRATDAVLEVGPTNDLVVVDGELRLTVHNARYRAREAVAGALRARDPVEALRGAVAGWRAAWTAERALRERAIEDVRRLGGDRPEEPAPPPGGWPFEERPLDLAPCGELVAEPGAPRGATAAALEALLAGWGAARDDTCASREALAARASREALRGDGHASCGRWAAVGECAANPGYMLASCGRSCELWADHAPEATAAVARRAQRRDAWAACAVDRVEAAGARYVAATSAELNGLARFHDALRNRTCAAYEADGTNPLAPAAGAATTTLDLDRPLRVATLAAPSAAAAIYHVEGFAAAAECRDAVADAAPRMAPATVNEEANKAAKSASRRAHAANLVPDLGRPDAAPTRLWRRAFALANALTDYDLDGEAGQEPFSVIHYNGSVAGAGPPDEYLPHCDGQCEGSPHQAGGRVATLLLYCRAPARGGATTFANARVAVAPRAGDAVFFSYLDAASGRMDVGHTLHSGCPVVEGDKWVLTLWFRKGVSAAEPWERFDPTGARHDATEVVAWDEGLVYS